MSYTNTVNAKNSSITELTWQLRGWAGDRQVPNVKYALQHNVGLGGAVVVSIYKKANNNKATPKTAYNPVSFSSNIRIGK